MTFRTLALIMLGLYCLESAAQSLPELARQERARRPASSESRVFTNENVQTGTAPERPSTPSAPAAAAVQSTAADDPQAGQRREAEWRAMFGEARAELARAEQRLELTQQELDQLNYRFLTESSLYNREYQLQPEIDSKREELTRAQARIDEAVQAIADLQQALRRSGAPPGWGRP